MLSNKIISHAILNLYYVLIYSINWFYVEISHTLYTISNFDIDISNVNVVSRFFEFFDNQHHTA